MEPVSRRGFFKQAGAAAAVAAVAGSVAITPLGIANAATKTRAASEPELSAQEDLGAHEELVAHVKNARTGEISLFIGHREVTFHDRKVAARLVRATR
ncbi:MAG: twin-arginine translocation signal domain-containing protein [Acidimicrobiales bacterium]|jgi:hypothetical protein